VKKGVLLRQGASTQAGTESLAALSNDFVEEASRRLALVAVVIGSIVATALILRLISIQVLGTPAPEWIRQAFTGGILLVLASIGLWLYSRSAEPRQILRAGSAYQLFGALCLVVMQFWGDQAIQDQFNRLTWLGVWILIFPLVVPAPPWRNALVSLASATAAPVVFFVWCAVGQHPFPAASQWLGTFLPYYLCAALAIAPAALIYRLGRDVSAAEREVRRLGSYRLIDKLGAGGMGEVWRGEHGMLARPAAIKLIKGDVLAKSSEEDRRNSMARFEREAKTTAALQSPHTIGLYDFGSTEVGDLYYAMELLDGIDLADLVHQFGPVPPARAAAILRQACESLAEAHDAGLVHRDIKPANIYLCRLGRTYDFVKVLDFGLVTAGERIALPSDLVELTGEGIVGTPAFMPPEQAQGQQLDGRTDIYALGCVGYYLLSGKPVFQGQSAIQMIMHHIQKAPPTITELSEQKIPAQLADLLLRCLAKDPADRPADAMSLARELTACDLGAPWNQVHAARWWGANADSFLAPPPDEPGPKTKLLPEDVASGKNPASESEFLFAGDGAPGEETADFPPPA
jgi:serine/threonine protein kinase